MTELSIVSNSKLIVSPDSFIVLAATDEALELLEAKPQEILGRPLLQRIQASEREDFRRTLKVSGKHAHPIPIQIHWLLSNGEPIKLESSSREHQSEHQVALLEITLSKPVFQAVGLRKEFDAPKLSEPRLAFAFR